MGGCGVHQNMYRLTLPVGVGGSCVLPQIIRAFHDAERAGNLNHTARDGINQSQYSRILVVAHLRTAAGVGAVAHRRPIRTEVDGVGFRYLGDGTAIHPHIIFVAVCIHNLHTVARKTGCETYLHREVGRRPDIVFFGQDADLIFIRRRDKRTALSVVTLFDEIHACDGRFVGFEVIDLAGDLPRQIHAVDTHGIIAVQGKFLRSAANHGHRRRRSQLRTCAKGEPCPRGNVCRFIFGRGRESVLVVCHIDKPHHGQIRAARRRRTAE